MDRETKSERSRRQVLDSALALFSHQGYGATSVREIADGAGVSTGSVYHHFPDKESIFRTLLDDYWALSESSGHPFVRALATGTFPDNLVELGLAARETVRRYRSHVALIYVDVIEFDGNHIRKFYSEMAQRFATLMEQEGKLNDIRNRLRPGVSPVSAMLLATRILFNYYTVEILFGVPEPFGKDSMEALREIADILRNGMT